MLSYTPLKIHFFEIAVSANVPPGEPSNPAPGRGSTLAKLEAVDLDQHPHVAEVFRKVQESRGWVSNLMRSLSHAPGALRQYSALGHYCRYDTDLTELQREIVVVTTVRGVEYGWAHHSGLARQCGATDEQLAQIKAGRVPESFNSRERALCAFVLEFSSFKGVAQDTLERLRQHFTPGQIVDAAVISAYYLAAGSLIVGFDVALEDEDSLQLELDWQKARLGA